MTEYRIRYEIDIEAETPLEAAREAYECMRSPESMLPILEVFENDSGQLTLVDTIDLDEEGVPAL